MVGDGDARSRDRDGDDGEDRECVRSKKEEEKRAVLRGSVW